jgi:hypothetical protein
MAQNDKHASHFAGFRSQSDAVAILGTVELCVILGVAKNSRIMYSTTHTLRVNEGLEIPPGLLPQAINRSSALGRFLVTSNPSSQNDRVDRS